MLVNIGYIAGESITKVYLLEKYREEKHELEELKDLDTFTELSREERKELIKTSKKHIKLLAEVLTYLGVGNEKDY